MKTLNKYIEEALVRMAKSNYSPKFASKDEEQDFKEMEYEVAFRAGLADVINDLAAKISELEKRIEELEGKLLNNN